PDGCNLSVATLSRHREQALNREANFTRREGKFFPALDAALRAPVLLELRRAQAAHAVLIDKLLPREEFFDRKRIALAGFLKGKQAGAHACDDLRLATHHPALGVGWRQIGKGNRLS